MDYVDRNLGYVTRFGFDCIPIFLSVHMRCEFSKYKLFFKENMLLRD